MTKPILKKGLALLLALWLAAGLLPLRASAAGVQVGTLAELQNALKTAKQTITLTATINVTEDTELDLNGCTVTCAQDSIKLAVDVQGGVLTVRDSQTGGKITGTGDKKDFVAVRITGGCLVLESGTISASTASDSSASAVAILVPSEYAYDSARPNAVNIYGGTVKASAKADTKTILFNTATEAGITVTGGAVSATSTTGVNAYAIYLKNNPFLISGGTVSAKSESSETDTFPYAVWRDTSSNPASDAEVRGASTKIDGLVYIHDGVNRKDSGMTGGKYSAQLNYAYVHSGCKLNMHLDDTDAPYFWWVSGGTAETYTINFNSNGGTGSMSSITAGVGEDRVLPACTFVKENCTFLGWSTSAGGTVQYKDKSSVRNLAAAGGSVTLYAVWHKETCQVTWYDYDGKTVLETDEVDKNAKPVFSGQEPTRIGATFRGWATAPEQSAGKPVGELPAVTQDTAYYAAFSPFAPEYCTLTWYDYTGKTRLDQSTVVTNSHPAYNGPQPTYTQEGYRNFVFQGWSTSPRWSKGTAVEDLPLVRDDASYFAAFSMEPITYAVDFKTNGGEGSMERQSFVYDAAQALSANRFTKTGYHFIGWAETADGPVKYTDGATVKNLSSTQGAVVALYAVWEIDLHTVTWYDQFGEEVLYQDTLAEYGSSPVFRGKLPMVIGGNFTGWATQPNQETGAQEKDLPAVTDDVNYYAAYKGKTPDYHTVTWMDFDGKTVLAIKEYAHNSAAVYPGESDPTRSRTGYTSYFKGWAMEEGQSKGVDLPRVTEDATYYATFIDTPNHYSVRFDYGDGTTSSRDQSFVYDEAQALEPHRYTKPGHHFICWKADIDGQEVRYQDQEVVKNLTPYPNGLVVMHAVWEINTYTVVWRSGDTVLDTTHANHGDKPTLNIKEEDIRPPLLGSEFVGWSTLPGQNTGTFAADLPAVTADIVYYAAYRGWTPRYKTVTWMDYEGKTVLDTETMVVNSPLSYKGEAPKHERTGYTSTFRGWAAQPNQESGTPEKDLPVLTEDVTYYAAFADEINHYKIHFDLNGADAGSMEDLTCTYDEVQILPANAFTKTGYHFDGWALTPDAIMKYYPDKAWVKNLTDEPDGVVTLYAVWKINQYKVTWCSGDTVLDTDTVDYNAQPLYSGDESAISSPLIGARFAGWATKPGQTQGTPDKPENLLPPVTEDTVYYAAFSGWTPNYYTITWMDYAGKNVLAVETLVQNAAVSYKGAFPTRTRTGYACAFKGWAESPGQPAGIEIPRASADATYYAAFVDTPNSYTVRFEACGGTGSMTDQSFTYDIAKALTKNAYQMTGHHFLGWADTEGGPVRYADTELVKNLTAAADDTVTLYAVWEINTYTVTWCNDAYVLEEDTEVPYNTAPVYNGAVPVSTRLGAEFKGWATRPGQTTGEQVSGLPKVTDDVVYYAAFGNWSPSYYAVTWMDYEGKTVLDFKSVANGSAAVFGGTPKPPVQPVKKGYTQTFEGWAATERQASGTAEGDLPQVTADVTYYAAFTITPNSYTVSFDSNGGEGSMAGQSFTYDAAQALNPNAFTKEHYHFLGWALSADGKVKYKDKAIVKNLAEKDSIKLYAVWEIDTYTVTWCSGDSVLDTDTVAYNVQPLYSGDEDAIPTPLVGAAFAGWSTKPGQTQGTPDKPTNLLPPVTEDTVYYAAFAGWAPNYYTVTWKSYDGKDVLAVETLVNNAAVSYKGASPTRSRTGYACAFKGWALTPGQSAGIDLPRATADAVYYAAFLDTPNPYTVRFEANGGEGSMAEQRFTYDTPQKLSANAFIKTGCHLLGWALTADGKPEFADKETVVNLAEQGAVTLYAVWEINSYTVIWRTISEILDIQYVDHGGRPAYCGAQPQAAGGTFAGWATEPNQTVGRQVADLPDVTADAVYYAAFSGWTPSYYTVTWMDYAGRTVLRTDTLVVGSAVKYKGTAPTRSRDGYACAFAGWAAQAGQSEGIELPRITANVTYYAAFLDTPNSYLVRFDANGGDGSMADQSFTYDAAQALSANAFTKTGCHFLGWAETAGGDVAYADGAVVRNLATDGSVTLYAVWEINEYTVTWCFASEVLKTTTVRHGDKPINDEEPFIAGGRFKGWSVKPGQTSGLPVEELPAVTDDIVYYAASEGWTPNYYKITWMDHNGSRILYSADLVYNAQPQYPDSEARPTRSRTGYISQFVGWAGMPGQTTPLAQIPRVTGNAVYYAAFTDTPITYTIAFDPNGGSGRMDVVGAEYDEFVALPAVGFAGGEHEIFLGWALTPSGEVRFADCATVINLSAEQGATVTLYAVWGVLHSITVSFDANGGTADRTEKTVWPGEPYGALPSAKRALYSFSGWYTERSGGKKVDASTVVERSEAHTLYAHWTENGGGGGGGDEPGKPTTSMNPDGSVTETRIDTQTSADGTVTTTSIETTTWPDGAKQEIKLVETERSVPNGKGGTTTIYTRDDSTVNTLSDGSVNDYHRVYTTETATSFDTAADGTVTETTVVQSTEKLTQTVTDTHGSVSGTETETISREETKTVTRRSADSSAVVTEEWSVDTRTTETEVGGAAQATVTERLAERSVSKTVSASGAVSGSGSYSERGSSSGPAGESSFTAEGTVTIYTDEKGSVLTVREGTRSTTAADGSARTVRERLTDGVSALGTTAGMEEIDGVLRSASAYLSDAAVEAARSRGIPAVIPLTVEPADSPESAVPIEVDLRVIGSRRLDGHLNVSDMPLAEIGVTERGVGIIAFYLAGDGTPAPIRECREGSVIFPVNDYMQVVIAHNDKSFPDVSMMDWFGSGALFTAAREVLIGTGELFEPDIWMSRAMVAQLIYNYERDRRAAPDDFDDVNPGDWFADAVGWAGSVGYVKGDGVSFRPYDPITRQDLVTILYRYALDEGYNVSARADLGRFPDAVDVADYAREALQWAVADGVILGMDDGTISPTTCATRAQVACIMQRFISTVRGSGTLQK